MKHILALLLVVASLNAFSQGGILNKAKQKLKEKTEQRAEGKIEEGIDKGLDEVENGIEGKNKKTTEPGEDAIGKKYENQAVSNVPSFESYSRYDFVPGAQLVYAEDFSQDVIGEFPLLWSTNNHGEVVTVKSQPGQWLRLFDGGHFVGPLLKNLPDNFTLEFDMMMAFPNEGYVYPSILFKLLQSGEEDKDGRRYLNDVESVAQTLIDIAPGEEGNSTIELNTLDNGNTYFNSGKKGLKKLSEYFGTPLHVAIWVQKSRFRMWINSEKIYDIPQAISPTLSFNRLALSVSDYYSDEEKIVIYLSNIHVAQGAADLRNKLITEGKWETNGIQFDVASDKIRPESYGVLKEMAVVLKENSSVKIQIIGHTDSDGDNAKNMDLSKRRAAAVKQALIKEFVIEESRMQTDGKGESKPVSDNKSKEGKAQNRRVEFVKLS